MQFFAALTISCLLAVAASANPSRFKREEEGSDSEDNFVHYKPSDSWVHGGNGGNDGQHSSKYNEKPHGEAFGDRPNILFLVADDLGYNDVGFLSAVRAKLGGGTGASDIRTPNLDALAAEGVILGNYYTQPVCTPSRVHILAGVHEVAAGLCREVIHSGQRNNVPLNLPTIANKLREQGYATHKLGKWNLGHWQREHLPTSRGFDTFFGCVNALTNHTNKVAYERFNDSHIPPQWTTFKGHDWWENDQQTYDYDDRHVTDLLQERFQLRFIEHLNKYGIGHKKPFYFDISFTAPHWPLEDLQEYLDQYANVPDSNRRIYAAMITHMDVAIGNIVNTIKAFPSIWANTIVVFTTDNGGTDRFGGNNFPLRGLKQSYWEGGVRAVGLVSSPKIQNKYRGTTSNGLIHISDWYPTFVSLAQGDTIGQNLYGYNVWNSINGDAPTPRTEILHGLDVFQPPKGTPLAGSPFDTRIMAGLRNGDWKVITGDAVDSNWYDIPPRQLPKPFAALTEASGKDQIIGQSQLEPGYVRIRSTDAATKNYWLFNIANDPLETTDLSAQYPDKLNELLGRLAWNYANLFTTCRYPRQDLLAQPTLHNNEFIPWVDSTANPIPAACTDQTLCPLS